MMTEEMTAAGDPALQTLWGLIEPCLALERLELDDLELTGGRGGRVLRVVVDGPGGVDLERLSEVAQGMSRLLDGVPMLQHAYQLEVTSPGLERRLRRPLHFAKSIGREVEIKTSTPIDGATSHRGILVDADDESCVVEIDGSGRSIPFSLLTSARTRFRWERAPKPGSKGGRR